MSFNGPTPSAVVVTFHHVLSVHSESREQDPKPRLVERAYLQRDQSHPPLNWEEDKWRGTPTADLHSERVSHKVLLQSLSTPRLDFRLGGISP